jgi:hypothetical protein
MTPNTIAAVASTPRAAMPKTLPLLRGFAAVVPHAAAVPAPGGGGGGSDEGGTLSAVPESPAALMTPRIRSTEALARFGANSTSATASSPTVW